MTSLAQTTHLARSSRYLRWVSNEGNLGEQVYLSSTGVNFFTWHPGGDFFVTMQSTTTAGILERWYRGATTYHERVTGLNNCQQIVVDDAGNTYVSFKSGSYYRVRKLDDEFATVWTSTDYWEGRIRQVVVDSNGDVIACSAYNLDESGYGELKKLNGSDGTTVWSKTPASSGRSIISVAVDGSDNVFCCTEDAANLVLKYNSSGTLQWTYSPTTGYISSRYLVAKNGFVYLISNLTNKTILKLKDNGTSQTEEWANSDYSSSLALAVGDGRVYVAPDKLRAFNDSDGSEVGSVDFTPYTTSTVIDHIEFDPWLIAIVGRFEIENQLNYGRWVFSDGALPVGPFEIANTFSLRGYGNKLIDKLYTKTNYVASGYRAVNIANVGDPIVEEWSYKAHSTMEYAYNVGVDSDYNTYVPCWQYYSAAGASAKSGGTITTAGYYGTIKKIDLDGVEIYETNITGIPLDIFVDPNDEYFFTRTGNNLRRRFCATGEEAPNDYWPILSSYVYAGCFKYGRDGYIYYARKQGEYTGAEREVYKLNPDGSTATDWSTPYVIPQHVWGTSPNWLDVNASGYVALGCVKLGEGGAAIKVVAPDKTLSWDQTIATYNSYGVDYILIDDTGNVIADIAWGDYIYKYPSGGGTPTWTVGGPLYNPYWSTEGNQEYFYTDNNNISATFTLKKNKNSDGSVVWYSGGQDGKSVYSFAGIAPVQVPAWKIVVTYTLNGLVKFWTYETDIGATVTSGESVYAETLKDYRFRAFPDAGYYIKEVLLDGVAISGGAVITLENVSYQHTLHIEFDVGVPSGPFTLALNLKGSPVVATQLAGHFDVALNPALQHLNWFVWAGHHSVDLAVTWAGEFQPDGPLLVLINNERAKVFLGPYVENTDLLISATAGAQELVEHGALQSTLQELLNVSGYIHLKAAAIPTTAATTFTDKDIFDAWMGDPTTEGYILDEDMDQIGIAVIEEGGDNHILVIFAKWHPQYTRLRLTENLSITATPPTPNFFNFLSAEEYAQFMTNAVSVYLPRYAAKIGNYEIPHLISFDYRLESNTTSYLRVQVIFSSEVFDEIEARSNEDIFVESIINYKGLTVRNEVVSVDFTEIEVIPGDAPKLIIGGYKTLSYYQVNVALRNVMFKVIDKDNKIRFRCSQPDFYLRPGCVATYQNHSIVVGRVVIFVQNGISQYMEVTQQ